QRTGDHRESDGPRCRTIVFRVLEVVALVCGDDADQQPDEHKDADNSATSHAAPPSVYRASGWRAAAVYPAGILSKPSGSYGFITKWACRRRPRRANCSSL